MKGLAAGQLALLSLGGVVGVLGVAVEVVGRCLRLHFNVFVRPALYGCCVPSGRGPSSTGIFSLSR